MGVVETGLIQVGEVGELFFVEMIFDLVPIVRFTISLMKKRNKGISPEKILREPVSTIQMSNFIAL